jgi:galactokinase
MSLSNLRTSDLNDVKESLSKTLTKRVTHVVEENERVRKAAEYLETNNIVEFGKLMYESHSSSRNLYEVSHPKLDLLVEKSSEHSGVLGARLTGAGLGGSMIAMMMNNDVPSYIEMMKRVIKEEDGKVPNIIVCEIPGGAITDTLKI